MRLPYEDEVRVLIRQRLEPELTIASALLDLAIGVYTSETPMAPAKGLDDLVVVVALGLVAKACKQYRAIVDIVELCLDEVANSNCRMLFETMLAVNFILRPRVILMKDGKKLKLIHGKPLTTKFRTRLYLANNAFNAQKIANAYAATPGLKRRMSKDARSEARRQATVWEIEIGPDWTRRLKDAYVGVGIIGLAESLGFGWL